MFSTGLDHYASFVSISINGSNLNGLVEPSVGRVDLGATCRQNLAKHLLLAPVLVAEVVAEAVQADDEEAALDRIKMCQVFRIWR